MKRRNVVAGLLILVSTFFSLSFTYGQTSLNDPIENQRDVEILGNVSWGDTYVGRYTSTNTLTLERYINGTQTNDVKLSVSSLQIGSESNYNNYVRIRDGGTLEVAGNFSVLGTNNNNRLLVENKGILVVGSDFDASMGGFLFNSGARLQVGAEVSNLDSVENGLNFTLLGGGATWLFETNLLTVGALTHNNSVSVSNNASLTIDNISIGSGGTTNNRFVVSTDAKATINDSINILGSENYLHITNNGILAVNFDFDASTGVDIQKGGILEAHRNLTFGSITNGGGIVMSGDNATWTNLYGSTLEIGTSNNDNFLTISNGATVRISDFTLGGTTNKNNSIMITEGGELILEGAGSYINATNSLTFEKGGKLTVRQNFSPATINWNAAQKGTFSWGRGGILEVNRLAPIFSGYIDADSYYVKGTLFLNDQKTLILNGSSALWIANTNNLHVGDLSSGNELIITNGAKAYVNSASIGDFKESGHDNHILITGTDSLLDSDSYVAIGGTIDNGNWIEGGISNLITVSNGGLLDVGTTLHNRNTTGTSGLNINPGGIVDVADYYQAQGALLNVYTDSSGTNAGLLRVANAAEFEAGARVGFDAIAALDIGGTYTNQIVEAGTLIVNGVTNATSSSLSALTQTGGSLVDYTLWVNNDDIYAEFTRRAISDGGGIDSGMLGDITDEIDRLASQGNSAASNQVQIINNILASQGQAELTRQLQQLYVYELPTYGHSQGMLGGLQQVRARGASIRRITSKAKPKGTPGPQSPTEELTGWIVTHGGLGNRDTDGKAGFDDGYGIQAYGTVLGIDRTYGNWLFGLGGGYVATMLDGDNGDESEGTTAYGLLYGSYSKKEWFAELVLNFGQTEMDNTSGTDFGVTSSTEASQTAIFLGGGNNIKDKESNALLRPQYGIQFSQYDQDAYAEKSDSAIVKNVGAFERWSYQSLIGASLVIPEAGKKIDHEMELRTFWLHEFEDDDEVVDYTLVGSSQPGQFIMRSPETDIVQLGVGYTAKWKSGVRLRFDLDGQFSASYSSTTVSGTLIYPF